MKTANKSGDSVAYPLSCMSGDSAAYLLSCWCVVVLLGLSAIQPLWFAVVRMTYRHPITFSYNEGWNVINTARFMHGQNLYVSLDRFPLTPVGYPPLSFIIVGGVSHLTPSPLLAGRAVALASLLAIAGLIYRTITAFTARTVAGVLGALVWIGYLTTDWGLGFVGYDDPQLLAHALSFGAFCLYVQWRHHIDLWRACVLGLFVSLGVFTKHIVVAVPLSIAADLLVENRRDFIRFITAAGVISLLMLSAVFAYGGGNVASNFLDITRRMAPGALWYGFRDLFVYDLLAGVFLPAAVLIYDRHNRYRPVLYYFVVSFAVALYAQGGVGEWRNVWLDFIIAAACVYGLFAAGEATITLPNLRWLGMMTVSVGLIANEFVLARLSSDGVLETPTLLVIRFWQCLVLLAGFGLIARTAAMRRTFGVLLFGFVLATSAIAPLRDFIIWDTARALQQLGPNEETYQADVAQLKAIPGPALFESMLLGFDAGKDFLYDPFNAAQMIIAGRISEQLLLDRIQARYFSVVVLSYDLDAMVAKLPNGLAIAAKPAGTASDRWTDNTVVALKKNYRKLGQDRLNRAFFYVPLPLTE